MIIRIGRPSDLLQINDIEKRVFIDNPWTTNMLAEELMPESDRRTWVMLHKSRIIGYIMARYIDLETNIINFVIDDKFKAKGFGEKLLNHFLANIKSKTSVFLEVKEGNFRAIKLYQKAGFREIASRNNYYGSGQNALIMKTIKY